MIIIHLRFDGGSTVEEHDIAHIASSILPVLITGFFFVLFQAAAALAALSYPSHILMYAPWDIFA
jgi:hypothetical protein